MRMSGAHIMLECLRQEGVKHIFGYPGGAVLPIYDALYDVEGLERDDSEEPFWKGVRRMNADGDHVDLAWNDPIDPRLLDVDDVQVECHLYDSEARDVAEKART